MARYFWPGLFVLSLVVKVKVDPWLSWKVPALLVSRTEQSKTWTPGPTEAEEEAADEEGATEAAGEELAVPAVSTGPMRTTDDPCIWGAKFKLPVLLKSMGFPVTAPGGV